MKTLKKGEFFQILFVLRSLFVVSEKGTVLIEKIITSVFHVKINKSFSNSPPFSIIITSVSDEGQLLKSCGFSQC